MQSEEGNVMAKVITYKCPGCGAKVEFDSRSQKMKCPYCDTTMDVEALKNFDDDLGQAPEDDLQWQEASRQWQPGETDGMVVYTCQSCGGEIVGDENTAAACCPYCDSPVIVTGKLCGDLKPDYVIPFKLDKKAAVDALNRHLKGKRLLPKVFKNQNHIEEVKGIYVPFWLFDADAHANMRYNATRTRMWSDSKYDYTETSHYDVRRSGRIGFSHISVDGSSKMADDLMESIEPFDFSQAVDFQTAYLSGYLADKYDVGSQESIGRANERVRKSTEEAFAQTVRGYSTVVPRRSDIRLQNGRTVYALYPVWILNTTWKNEKYIFAMNGQTGKFVGNLPMDMGAFWKYFFALTGIYSAVLFIVCCLALLL